MRGTHLHHICCREPSHDSSLRQGDGLLPVPTRCSRVPLMKHKGGALFRWKAHKLNRGAFLAFVRVALATRLNGGKHLPPCQSGVAALPAPLPRRPSDLEEPWRNKGEGGGSTQAGPPRVLAASIVLALPMLLTRELLVVQGRLGRTGLRCHSECFAECLPCSCQISP